MVRRNQPYIALYVQDFLTDEKLNECSAESTGVYIRLMCVMHKSDEYGTILLKQKDKQTGEQLLDFAVKLTKQLPFTEQIIHRALVELVGEGVLRIDGDKLYQKRMVNDAKLSNARALAGQKGGKRAAANRRFANDFATAKRSSKAQANAENEIDIDIENDIDIDNDIEIENDESNVSKDDEARDTRFDEFWSAYPKKVGKKEAQRAWVRAKVNGELFDKIIGAIEQAKTSEQWHSENGRYVPNPATWLNQGRWDDEPTNNGGMKNDDYYEFTPSTGFSRTLDY